MHKTLQTTRYIKFATSYTGKMQRALPPDLQVVLCLTKGLQDLHPPAKRHTWVQHPKDNTPPAFSQVNLEKAALWI